MKTCFRSRTVVERADPIDASTKLNLKQLESFNDTKEKNLSQNLIHKCVYTYTVVADDANSSTAMKLTVCNAMFSKVLFIAACIVGVAALPAIDDSLSAQVIPRSALHH